jgi:hypothetical protein
MKDKLKCKGGLKLQLLFYVACFTSHVTHSRSPGRPVNDNDTQKPSLWDVPNSVVTQTSVWLCRTLRVASGVARLTGKILIPTYTNYYFGHDMMGNIDSEGLALFCRSAIDFIIFSYYCYYYDHHHHHHHHHLCICCILWSCLTVARTMCCNTSVSLCFTASVKLCTMPWTL